MLLLGISGNLAKPRVAMHFDADETEFEVQIVLQCYEKLKLYEKMLEALPSDRYARARHSPEDREIHKVQVLVQKLEDGSEIMDEACLCIIHGPNPSNGYRARTGHGVVTRASYRDACEIRR
jgi:hypothetical protein